MYLPHTATPMPLSALGMVTHIGTLNPAHKGQQGESYEGRGVSISVDPEDWEAIAQLGGNPWWEADLTDKRLLDGHAALADKGAEWARWGEEEGLIKPCAAFAVSWYDSEQDQRLETLFATREKAEEECEFLNEDEDAVSHIEERSGWAPTAALLEAMGHDTARAGAPESDVFQAVVTVWAQRAGLDGVWWEDDYAPENLSAPRGVIFPEKVLLVGFACVREAPRPRPGPRR